MKIVLDVIASPEDDRSNVPEIKTSVIEGNAPRRGGGAAVSIYLWRYPPPGLDWGRAWTPSRRASGESDSLFNTPEWGDDARIMLVAQETSALDFFVTDSMTMIGQASGSLVLTGGLDKEIPLGFSPQDFVFEFRRVAFSASSDEQSKSVDWSGEVTKIENQNEERVLESVKAWDVWPDFLRSFLLGSIGLLLFDIQKWLRKSEQGDKWNRCLIEGMIVPSETGSRDEQTTPP